MVIQACNPSYRRLRQEDYKFEASLDYLHSKTMSQQLPFPTYICSRGKKVIRKIDNKDNMNKTYFFLFDSGG
jgi:hypothetical protein